MFTHRPCSGSDESISADFTHIKAQFTVNRTAGDTSLRRLITCFVRLSYGTCCAQQCKTPKGGKDKSKILTWSSLHFLCDLMRWQDYRKTRRAAARLLQDTQGVHTAIV